MIEIKIPGRGATQTNAFGPWRARATYVALTQSLADPISIAGGGVAVVAQPVWAGQSATAAFPAGVEATTNYTSSAGTIVSVVREISINGAAFVDVDEEVEGRSLDLIAGQPIAVRVTVTDSAENVRRFPADAGSSVTVQALPVPVLVTAPAITGGAAVGQTPAFTAATWQAVPATPPFMQREVETRFTIAAEPVAVPLAPAAQGQQVRVEQRARHVLNLVPGPWTTSWAQSAPVTVSGVVTVPAVNPLLVIGEAVPGGAGIADGVRVPTYSYGATDIVDLHVVTGVTVGFAITEAQMKAGAGGAGVDFVTFPDWRGFTGAQEIVLDGFTTNAVGSNPIAEIAFLAAERNNGGSSGIQRVAVTGVDFEELVALGWQTDTTGAQVIGTFDDDVLGDLVLANWVVSGRSVTDVALVGRVITLSVVPSVAFGDAVTVGYGGGNLRDDRGLELQDFGDVPVTNNVPAGAAWDAVAGNGTITINSQPTKPATPVATAGNGTITITG